MGLLDEVRAEQAGRRRGGKSAVTRVLESLDDAERDELLQIMRDDLWTSISIASALKARGFEVNDEQIRRHRVRLRTS